MSLKLPLGLDLETGKMITFDFESGTWTPKGNNWWHVTATLGNVTASCYYRRPPGWQPSDGFQHGEYLAIYSGQLCVNIKDRDEEIVELVRALRASADELLGSHHAEASQRAAEILQDQAREARGLRRLVDWYQAEYVIHPPKDEIPAAWLWQMTYETRETAFKLSFRHENPFGVPGVDYSDSFEVTAIPLYEKDDSCS